MRNGLIVFFGASGFALLYYVISPFIGLLDFRNSKDVCFIAETHACYLSAPFMCEDFPSPCSVPVGWYVPAKQSVE